MKLALALAPALLLAAVALAGPPAAQGDPKRGEIAFQKCYACHDLAPANDVAGPSLHAIVGRPVAARAGFDYSPALRAFAADALASSAARKARRLASPVSGSVSATALALAFSTSAASSALRARSRSTAISERD